MPQPRDDIIHFVAGQLPAFARLRALRHLDLQFVGIDQIVRGHAESRRGHLLHRAAPQIAVGVGLEALFVFPALARIRFAADAVHGDGQRLVRLFADRTERHRSGRKALDDFFGGLDFFDRNRSVRLLKSHQSAQGTELRFCLSMRSVYSSKVLKLSWRTACCSLLMVSGFSR